MKKKKIIQASIIQENINDENKITNFTDRQDLLKKNQETTIFPGSSVNEIFFNIGLPPKDFEIFFI